MTSKFPFKRVLIALTGLTFAFGVFCHLFSFLIPEIFYLVSFSLMIGLLVDYAWSIRKNILAIIPAWLAVYPLYLLLHNMEGLDWISFYLEFVYFLFYPVFGLVFIWRGIQMFKEQNIRLGIHFSFLGLTGALFILNEFGKDWTVKKHMPFWLVSNVRHFKWLWLVVFLHILIIDVFEKLDEKGYQEESTILRWALPLISIKFFSDYLFV